MSKVCRYKFLVIDDADLLEVNNLNRKVNQAIKHGEPVFRLDAPWDRKNDLLDFFSVIYDEEQRIFKMWYSVVTISSDLFFWHGPRTLAYATSTDGIHWEKPVLGMFADNGSTQNNYLTPQMGAFSATVIEDPSDVPARRYKMIFHTGSDWARGGETEWAGFHVPLSLAYSADGLHWDRPVHVNPVIRGLSDAGWSFFYDVDRRKYVLLTRRVPNLPRDISLYESYDLVNWEDKGRILVPGDQYDPPEMYNFQTMAPFRYEDFYLGMLDTQYTLPASESYEVYNKPPADYPCKRLGQIDIQLAYSRDGRTWNRPIDRSAVVPNGGPGEPDCGHIFPGYNPVVINGETWIFYLALIDRHNAGDKLRQIIRDNGDVRNRSCYMLAKMPEDHWVSLDAGTEEGSFICKPWGPPHEVFVNADAQGGSIEVELITPYREPVPGYSRKECIPITANGKDQEVKWKCGRHPWDFAEDYRGGVLVKFYLKNAKLYSYTFTLPDPDGQLERDKANARWLELIKHRSDNWDRPSNEPAIGLPPHSGPGPEKGQEKPGQPTWDV